MQVSRAAGQTSGYRNGGRLSASLVLLALLWCVTPPGAHAESTCIDSSSNATRGSLTDSGGSSGVYANNEDCEFLIAPPSADSITLSFSSFNYETNFDFLRVYDGTSTSAPLLGTFTGTSVPAALTARSGAMLVVHSSDFSITRAGFAASWSSTTASTGSSSRLCFNRSATTETGTVTDSGGSAGFYANNEDCQFLIQPPSADSITLSFSSFDYEANYDFLRVYDGTSTSDPLLGVFSGSNAPVALTARSGAMLVVHSSDFSITRAGFIASWSVPSEGSCAAESVGDRFDSVSYSGNTGSENWTTDWLEIGENDGPTTGISRVNSRLCSAGNCLRLGEPGSASSWSNRGVEREANLLGATAATLQFNYYTGRSTGTQSVALAVSGDGGRTWTTLRTYSINSTNFTANPESFDLSGFVSENTRIRFLSSGTNATIGMYIDDLQIAYQPTCLPTAVAEWRFDEPRWKGVAEEVGDVTGNLNGRAVGGANTIAAGRVCGAASFDGVDDAVTVVGIDETLAGTATLSYWLQTTQPGNNTAWVAPGLTGVEVSGGSDDIFWGWLDGNGRVVISAANSAGARSISVVNDGNWHHVVLTRDEQSGQVQVFVDGTREASQVSLAGTIGTSFEALGVVRNTSNRRGQRLNAVVDEVVMFDVVLSDAEIADIYRNQLASKSWNGEPRNCPITEAAGLIIDHDQSGINCLAEPVSVRAVDATRLPVSTYGNEITLDTQTGRGSWTLQSGDGTLIDATPDDGLATYQFAAADGGQASFFLAYEEGRSPMDVDAYQSDSPIVRDDDSEGTLAFAPSGFTLTATALPNPPPVSISDPISAQVAATNFSIHIAAFGTTDTDPECGVIETYQGDAPLEFWTGYSDPASGTRTATINGSASAGNEAGASIQSTAFVNGQAQVTARYKDAGSIRVHAKDETTFPHTLNGATNSFVVRPSSLVVSGVESLSGDPNPAAADMTGAGFVPSGQNFRVVVEARDADGDITPNFGLEAAPELVSVLSSGLVVPVGGRHGSADGVIGGDSLIRTGAGTFSSATVMFDEVGIIRLSAAVRDGNYLGIGSVPGSLSGNVGRFYPASIALASGNVSTACGNYVYQNEPGLQLSYTLRALNALGAVVENYDADLLGAINVATVLRQAENADSGLSLAARLSNGSAQWRSGVLSELDVSAVFSRLAAPDGPFDDLQISLTLDDPRDSLVIDSANLNASTIGDCVLSGNCNAAALGGPVQVRYGRLVVLPRSSSELADLDVPLVAQYFDGSEFRRHGADNCSSYSLAAASLSDFQDSLAAGETNPIGPAVTARLVDGEADFSAPLLLSAPGAGNVGSVLLQLDAPAWLEYDWFGTGAVDPSARQSFGSYRGHDRVVFWGEVYE